MDRNIKIIFKSHKTFQHDRIKKLSKCRIRLIGQQRLLRGQAKWTRYSQSDSPTESQLHRDLAFVEQSIRQYSQRKTGAHAEGFANQVSGLCYEWVVYIKRPRDLIPISKMRGI